MMTVFRTATLRKLFCYSRGSERVKQTQKHILLKITMPLGQEVSLSKYLHSSKLKFSAKVLFPRKL